MTSTILLLSAFANEQTFSYIPLPDLVAAQKADKSGAPTA
jgi:hypothetical protein